MFADLHGNEQFGGGMRACLAHGFSEQAMLINLAMALQKFQLEKADPHYELDLRWTMSISPLDFKMKVRRRTGRSLTTGIPGGGT